ncbi:MAG TPA: heme-binding protein, partial [Bryobacteraceae bacterium]|nr:heme-binding protein [Bryobacteraceae bacterium]
DQAPLCSRTVRFISGIHFPPGIAFTSNAPLYGIENSNRGCPFHVEYIKGQDFPPARSIDGVQPGLGILTGKANLNDSAATAVNPGGVPLFKQGVMVGGIGVAGVTPEVAEFAALSGAVGAGFGANPAPPGVVIIGGIALPFVNQTTRPEGYGPGSADGSYALGPLGSPKPPPEGDLVAPRAGPLGGLTQDEVQGIVNAAVAEANLTRAVIRLPIGSRARMVIAVADLDGAIIALHRMPDATVFSIDVAVAKSRNVIFFSGPNRTSSDLPGVPMGTAVTNRTIGFGGQPIYPPGIDGTAPGPFFELYQFDTLNPCTQGSQAANPNQNGVVFFPGALPLYKNGVLVGGLGVSGDGVDQDDFVTSAGATGFDAPANIQADQIIDQGVRLPYLKFPQNPTY